MARASTPRLPRKRTLDPWNKVSETCASKVGVTEAISRCFNPLAHLDPNSRQFSDDVALISDAIIFTPPGADPHWADSARELVTGLLLCSLKGENVGVSRPIIGPLPSSIHSPPSTQTAPPKPTRKRTA